MNNQDSNERNYFEGGSNNVAIIIGGVVMMVVIVILCVLIWRVYHDDGPLTQDIITQESSSSGGDDDLAGTDSEESPDTVSGEESREETSSDSSDEGPSGSEQTGQSQEASQGSAAESNPSAQGTGMTFTEVDETVTAKEVTNLRSKPGTTGDDTVVTQLSNGQTAHRTGINEAEGWSRLEYNGQTLYAVNRLLTTDLSAPEPQTPAVSATVVTAGGRKITFTECDDYISPKIEVNLRGEPATDQGNASVHYLIKYGEKLHRTGYDDTSGWSRVEYNGEVLYVVTSLTYVVEDEEETQGE